MTATIVWGELKQRLRGDLSWSGADRGAYATDASVYQQFPQAIAFPRDDDDVAAIIQFCRERGVPVIGRGGGTSLSGQAIGAGVIVDFSRFMNRVVSVDPAARMVTVEPGVVLDDLNAQLLPHRLFFAPDPATASRATIGGMIGNNACGTRSLVFGRTGDAIESLRCVLADGRWMDTTWLDAAGWQQAGASAEWGDLYRGLDTIMSRYGGAVRHAIPELPRIAAGYSLRRMLPEQPRRSLSDVIVGGEGTLALATRATLRLRPVPEATSLVVAAFATLDQALESLPLMLQSGPSAVELLDDVLLAEAVQNAATRDLSRVLLPTGAVPAAILLVEFLSELEDSNTAMEEVTERARAAVAAWTRELPHLQTHLLLTPAEQHQAWEVRRLGLGLISNIPGRAKAIALIEDACLPVERLPEYNRFVYAQGARWGLGISAYAHASVGVLHYKVMLDLHEPDHRHLMRQMAEACFEKCRELGGVFSGEHGDGIVRGEFLERQFGPDVYRGFVAVKELFDPRYLLNPQRKIDAPPLDRWLRYGDAESDRQRYQQVTSQVRSRFRYGPQENLVVAIEQCNGVGACRKNLKGTMCPSYRATREERDSTRGRANLLRLAISGQLQPAGLANPDLHQALDLCLSCKACKSECPNAVDMARLKSEALQAKWDAEGVSPGARFVGGTPQRLAWASRFPRLAQWALALPGIKSWLQRRYGFDPRRALPLPSRISFARWWRDFQKRMPRDPQRPVVAVLVDTWNRFLEPEIGCAAIELLAAAGFRVELLDDHDALRTRLSVGLLDEARQRGDALFHRLRPWAERGIPLVCLEPSEASALTDDLPDLISDSGLGRQVAQQVCLLEEFLWREVQGRRVFVRPRPEWETARPRVKIHPHCHQRAVQQPQALVSLLRAAGFEAELTDWGCCGMAGSFGYGHYDVSMAVAELKFAPGLRQAGAAGEVVVGSGTSCREQAAAVGGNLRHWVTLVSAVRGEATRGEATSAQGAAV